MESRQSTLLGRCARRVSDAHVNYISVCKQHIMDTGHITAALIPEVPETVADATHEMNMSDASRDLSQ
jgi:hypothetical protein